jgi:hypothetical protein
MPKPQAESRIRQARRSKIGIGKIRAYLPGNPTVDPKALRMFMKFLFHPRRRWRAAGFAVILSGLAAPVSGAWAAEAGTIHLRCANVASGANWQLVVDLDHKLVDTVSATITDKWISWNDPKQGVFELERATGKLQFRNASSTGGYFLYYTCKTE